MKPQRQPEAAYLLGWRRFPDEMAEVIAVVARNESPSPDTTQARGCASTMMAWLSGSVEKSSQRICDVDANLLDGVAAFHDEERRYAQATDSRTHANIVLTAQPKRRQRIFLEGINAKAYYESIGPEIPNHLSAMRRASAPALHKTLHAPQRPPTIGAQSPHRVPQHRKD